MQPVYGEEGRIMVRVRALTRDRGVKGRMRIERDVRPLFDRGRRRDGRYGEHVTA